MTMGLDDIAIIGMGLRAPRAADYGEFWENLVAGRDCIARLTDEQLLEAGEDPAVLADPRYVRARPLLDDVWDFDNRFFGMSGREAELRNPQHRLFLELCSTALQDGGYDPARYDGSIGVYGGNAPDRFAEAVRSQPELYEQVGELVTGVSNNIDYLATYVSYRLGLRGPSMSVRTACSTSLVAVHLACQALRQGECDLALAGGVEIEMPYGRGYLYVDGSIDSRDGVCRPLDADASGTVFGSGGGVVLLKRLEDALDDGDDVVAVIRGSAVNNDGGEGAGYTAPSPVGQERVIREAVTVAQVDPATIGYVELHGTGTTLGDPIEVRGLAAAFRATAAGELPPASCEIGSVKSNVGHLGPASGVTGLIKVALMMRHEYVPPTINVTRPNPKLELASTPFAIADVGHPWRAADGQPRRAGVSSFGLGGTNAHVVVEEAPPVPETPQADEVTELLVWSAADGAAEAAVREQLAAVVAKTPAGAMRHVARTLQVGRPVHVRRGALVVTDPAEAAARLAGPGTSVTSGDGTVRRPVLLFPGQGAQRPRSGTGLARRWPAFDVAVREHLEHFSTLMGIDLVRVWQEEDDPAVVAQTVHAQPLLFSVELGLARALESIGVVPSAVAGHSVGELVAATVAGVLDPAEAMLVVARRAELMQDVPPGRMLAVLADEVTVRGLLVPGVWVSAVNGTRQVVVGGSASDVERFQEVLVSAGVPCQPVPTSHGFHTPMMEPAAQGLAEVVRGCTFSVPRLPLVSAAAGTLLDDERALSPDFWGRQVVDPVRYLGALDTLATMPAALLLEAGPGTTLVSLAQQHGPVRAAGHRGTSLLGRAGVDDEWAETLAAIGAVWAEGTDIDWEAMQGARDARRVPLPVYPYQRRTFEPPQMADRTAAGVTSVTSAEPVAPEAQPLETAPTVEDDGTPVLAVPGWRPDDVVTPVASVMPASRGTAVVLLPDDADEASRTLTSVQMAGFRAVAVRPGTSLEVRRGHRYTVRPDMPDDAAELLRALADDGIRPDLVVDAMSLGGGVALDDPGYGSYAAARVWSLVATFQALVRPGARSDAAPALVALTRGAVDVTGAEGVDPSRAMLPALLRSATMEFGVERARLVDLGGVEPAVLAAELTQPSPAQPVVALRGPLRWVPALHETTASGPSPSFLVQEGVYVVTGGLGGVGLAVAEALTDAGLRPRLALVSRTAADDDALPEEVRARLAALEEAGASVLRVSADVGDEAALRRAVHEVRTILGPIDGVFHVAGRPGGGLLVRRGRADVDGVLRPKVDGSLALRTVVSELPEVRFLVFFSSRASLNGLLGSADYAAANAFQDGLARASRGLRATVLSVSWPVWHETGMAAPDWGTPRELPGATVPTAEPAPASGTVEWTFPVTPTTWLVDEHRIDDEPVLPGSAYVDLLVRAARTLPGVHELDPVVIEGLAFTAPLQVLTDLDVTVRLTPTGEGTWQASVVARHPNGTTTHHASATVDLTSEEPRRRVDLDAAPDGDVPLPFEEQSESGPRFRFGPRFACVRAQQTDPNDESVWWKRLELDPTFHGDLDTHAVHPGLLDRALALPAGARRDVPFSIGRIVLYADLPARLTSRLAVTRVSGPSTVLAAELHDALGRVVAEVSDIVKLDLRRGEIDKPATPREAPASGQSPTGWAIGLTSGVTPHEGVTALLSLLTENVPPHVAVVPREEWRSKSGPQGAPSAAPPSGPRTPASSAPRQVTSTHEQASVPDEDRARTVEEEVTQLWAEMLGEPDAGPDADFFRLGGDSLTAVQLMSRLRERLGVAVTIADLFEHPTPRGLASMLDSDDVQAAR